MTALTDPSALVSDLGFLVRRDVPRADRDALLVIALREIPTGRHYDPEVISYWRTGHDGRGHRAELSLATPVPLDTDFAWGPIELIDRYGVTNTFVSFGGRLTAHAADGAVVSTFRSPAPILRRGGHSQRYDGLAAEVTAFFARLLVPIDFMPGAERLISDAPPLVRYAAFLRHDAARLASGALVREVYGPDARLVPAEVRRMRQSNPAAWQAGGELLERLRIGPVKTA